MKKQFLTILSIIILTINLFAVSVNAEDLELDAKNAILIDMQNGMVLYEKKSDEKIQPAGYTKIATALVVLENCNDLEQVITASPQTIASCDFSYGNMGILGDEELTVRNILEGMLIYDASEAAELLANFTFGSYEKFIACMNELAERLGAQDTVFKNAGGYYDDEQYTTVRDISLIANYAMKNDAFAEIVKKDLLEIAPTNKYHQTRYLSNTNMFVGRARSVDFYSEKVFGVKTSYIKDHGYGICIAFNNSKGKFMCVTANGANATSAHTDAQALRVFSSSGFTNVILAKKDDIIEEILVPNGSTSHVLLKTSADLSVRLPIDYDSEKIFKWTEKTADIKAPIKKGDVLGKLFVSYDGETIGNVDLIAYDSVNYSAGKSVRLFFVSIFTSPFFYVPVIALALAFIFSVYKAYRTKNSKKK